MGMVKMRHINIYGPEKNPKPALEVLAREKCFDPDKTAERINATTATENVYAPLLTQVTGLLKDLGASATLLAYDGTYYAYKDVRDNVETYAKQVAERGQKKAEDEARLATFEQTKVQLYHLSGLKSNIDEIFSCKYLKVRFGRLPKDSFIKLPYYEDKSFTFEEYDFDGENHWGMYFVPESAASEVDDIFASLYFERVWVPDFVHGTPQAALAQLIEEASNLHKELDALNNMSDIADAQQIAQLQKMQSWANYESQIFDMQKNVIVLEHSYYISGYVPTDDVGRLKKALGEVHGVKAAEDIVDNKALRKEKSDMPKPPVRLKNNWFARPFEMFIDMYGLPGYGDLDPTSFVAITYAVLFGAMFGDVGQGVLLGLIGYFIMYKIMKLDVGWVLARCSIFSVFFGFIYGSVFGFEEALNPVYQLLGMAGKPLSVMDPEGINFILISSIAAGVFIIAAAIITGIISNFIRGIYAKTIFSVNGLAGLAFYFSLILLLLKLALGINLPFVGTVPFYILCLAVPFVSMYFAEPICQKIAGEKITESVGELLMSGFFDMFDAILSFASNTMSFLRVGAFVLAHAGMMSVVFTLAGLTSNTVIYVIILIVGNLFVMALEGLFVAIQVLRLEFYEVFSRFFEATGVPFEPLEIRLTNVID